MMLYRKNDATLDFDLAKVVEQSKENPVFYVQYAHARCASIFRQAAEAFPGESFDSASLLAADLSVSTTTRRSRSCERSRRSHVWWRRAPCARTPSGRVLSLRSRQLVPSSVEQGQGSAAFAVC
jgi:hypothetical protein